MSKAAGGRHVGADLTEGHIAKTLIIFAIPLLLANLVQQLYNTVDLIIIGQFAGSAGTVGTSTGGDLANMLTMIGMGFSGAGQVYIAQLAGAKDERRIKNAIGTLMTIMLGAGLVLGVIGACIARPFLHMLNTPPEAFSQATDYMIVTCLGMPFVFGYNAVCGILRGMGESKQPLYFVSIAAASNVVLDLFFVAVLRMASLGTAIATVIAQAVSCIAGLIFMYRHREQLGFDFKPSSFKLHKEPLKVIIRLGIPKAAQGALINVSMLYCSAQVNSFGLVAAATNNVGNKITRFSNIVTQSIDTGAAAMIGQNLGARKYDRAKRIVYTALMVSGIMVVLNCTLALTIPKEIFHIFSNDPEVIEFGVEFMRISVITFILSGIMGPYNAMITGDGNANLGLLIGILDGVILRIGISVVMANVLNFGVTGYFYGNALARIAPCFISGIYFYSGRWKKRKLLVEQ